MKVELTGKVAVVTGAARGVGLAIVQEYLASHIAGVIAVDRATEVPESLQTIIERESSRLAYIGGDVRLEATAESFVLAAMARFGRLDVLVNNAGVSVVKPIHLHTEEEWDFVMDTNVKALFWAAKHVVPIMMEQRSGVVLNAGSISGHVGLLGQGAYGPSKGAVHQMTRQMAIEYAPYNIRINAIALGTVDTPIVQWSAEQSGDPEGFVRRLKSGHPIGRIASPEEVAKFFTYLASDHASFFSGAVLSMDGGYIAQ